MRSLSHSMGLPFALRRDPPLPGGASASGGGQETPTPGASGSCPALRASGTHLPAQRRS